MKKYFLIVALTLLVFVQNANAQFQKEVIFFSQPCKFCEKLKNYLDPNIIPKYPEINFRTLDIRKDANRKLLQKYVKEYKIDSREVELPLMFIGSHYIMGWDDSFEEDLVKNI